MKKSQSGFTLVELVVVILVLGILSATALPRFMNVSSQAHSAAVSGAGGSFGAAIALAHAQWVANATVGADNAVADFGEGNVSVNAAGWPIQISTGTATDFSGACVNVWENILQGPPTIAVSTGTTITTDYLVITSEGTGTTTSEMTKCTYQYVDDLTKTIIYDATNGAVTISQ